MLRIWIGNRWPWSEITGRGPTCNCFRAYYPTVPLVDDLLSKSVCCVDWPTPHNLVVPGSNLDPYMTGGEGGPLGSPSGSFNSGLVVLSNSTFLCTQITVIPETVPGIRHRKMLFSNLSSLPSVFSSIAILFCCSIAILIVRSLIRALVSPLKHQPGPAAARFSRLWYLSKVWRGDFEKTNVQLHKKYGECGSHPLSTSHIQ